jgi:hypothetical protein
MYLYNVTVTIEDSIHDEWLRWMKGKHIPDVLGTGCFVENRICRLITQETEITYAIQYTFHKMEDLTTYQQEHAPRLQKELSEKFKDQYAVFRSILEIIE